MVVDENHHARLQTLAIGRDYGVTLEVLTGLKPDDWIVLNPADSLIDGQEVHVKEVPNPMAPAPAAAPSTPTSPQNTVSPQGKKS